jgi:DNA-binding LytR/AlgR family response regulator
VSGLRLLAVDDEVPALEDLARMLASAEGVDTVDRASGGNTALRRLNEAEQGYDAIFLDVRMPDLDGLDLARVVRQFAAPPRIVFVSAHPAAAVDGFDLGVFDFLVKPVSRSRLDRTLAMIAGSPAETPAFENGDRGEIIPVDSLHGAKRLIARSSVLYARAQGDYVRVVTDQGRFLLRGGLGEIAEQWEPYGFARVHRQYAVNLKRALELRPHLNGTATLVFPGERSVPVSRRRIADLRRRLHF